MNKKIIFSVLVSLILMILACVSVSALVDANLTVGSTVNNSILAGTVKLNFTIVSTLTGENVTTVNYTFTRVDGPGILPILFCTNGTVGTSRNNITECTNNTITSLPDGIYNITISAYNESTNATFGRLIVSNVSVENWGPRVNITSPGANGTQLTDASFINREFEINFTILDNLAAHGNRSFFCELRIAKQLATSKNLTDIAVNNLAIFNKTTTFTNGSNITFKVPSRNILLNGSQSSYQVSCRNSEQAAVLNQSLVQNLTVSDTVLPNNVTSPTFKDSNNIAKTKFEFGDTVTISDCSGTDNTDGAVQYNITVKFPGISSFTLNNVSLTFSDTSAIGTYEVNCSASDSNGNINSSLKTFEIIPKIRDTSSYAISKAGKPVSKGIVGSGSAESVDVGAEGTGRLIAEGGSLRFTVNNEEHMVIVKEIGKDSVILTIKSTPFDLSLNKGDAKDVDVDEDGIEDINVKFNGVFYNKADVTLTLLEQTAPKKTTEEKPATPSSKVSEAVRKVTEGKGGIWLVIIVVIIIVVVGYLLVRKR